MTNAERQRKWRARKKAAALAGQALPVDVNVDVKGVESMALVVEFLTLASDIDMSSRPSPAAMNRVATAISVKERAQRLLEEVKAGNDGSRATFTSDYGVETEPGEVTDHARATVEHVFELLALRKADDREVAAAVRAAKQLVDRSRVVYRDDYFYRLYFDQQLAEWDGPQDDTSIAALLAAAREQD